MKVAIVRGKFLNKYEMQLFEPLARQFQLVGFGSLAPYHDDLAFPVIKLPSPMDVPDVPFKMQILNRMFVDAHYLFGLETQLSGFDLVHTAETYYHYTQQCLRAKQRGLVKKVIATVLENIPFNNEGIWGRTKFKEKSRAQLDHIIALTHRTKEALLLEGADPEKITVISHGIDTKKFFPTKEQTVRISNKHIKQCTILFSGRLEKYKGVYEILFAAKRLLMDKELADISLRFLFVGNGSELGAMQHLEKRLGIDTICEHTNASYAEMPSMYAQADIAVAPSKPTYTYQEQYCTALLEAQAMGLPIVATKSGGIEENVADAALLISPADYRELSEAIKTYIMRPTIRIAMANRARKRAETVHDVRILSKKIAALYQRVVQ